MIETEGLHSTGIMESEFRKIVEQKTPFKRIGQPDDVGGVEVSQHRMTQAGLLVKRCSLQAFINKKDVSKQELFFFISRQNRHIG
mgnify:CR=1 FL=1